MIAFIFDSGSEKLTCKFEGAMNSHNCSEAARLLEEQLATLISSDEVGGARSETLKIVFDLAEVEFVSSTFLRIVMMMIKRIPKENFSITNANQFISDLFKMSALDQLLDQSGNIECHMQETRVFPPSEEFATAASIKSIEEYQAQHRESLEHPEAFWGKKANEHIEWFKPWDTVLEWTPPDAKWFVGGKLNVSYNCLDKHLNTPLANKAAIIWEGEPESSGPGADERVITYRQLHRMVCMFANVLKRNGVGRGDRVLIYLPMVPEAVVAMQACARIGAIHSVVFGGFSAQSVADRIKDCGAKVVVTADGGYRRGGIVQLKSSVDEALELEDDKGNLLCDTIEKMIVLRRMGTDIRIVEGRDVWWHQELQYVSADCPAEAMNSEDVLFILYTSGSTGKPKGIFHTTAGYLLGTKLTHEVIFDLKDTDVFWCTADVGWITGHSYVAYGPLANGATVLMYEGAPNYPDAGRFWRIVEKYGVTIFYTAPTAIRAFMQWGDKWPKQSDLSSLRLLGTVGEPINPQAWIWYNELIGGERCPIVDTWWQTETGGIMISALPGAIPTKPGSATVPFFGVQPEVVDDQGEPVPVNSGGKLIIRKPWPSMLRGIWGDPDRYHWTYWNEVPENYFSGDGARQDEDGYFWIVGRIDDVLNVSGHRIGTAEVESALVSHTAVAEAAVVGRADDVKGFAVVAFVTLISGEIPSQKLREELRVHVGDEVGAVARPDEIRFAGALPKTRSGKIMRRLLKQIAAGTEITGDTTTLEDFSVLAALNDDKEI